MATKNKKSGGAADAAAASVVPSSTTEVLKEINKAREQRLALAGQKASVDALKIRYLEAKKAYAAAVAQQADGEAALIAAYPDAGAILNVARPTRAKAAAKGAKRGRKAKAANLLSLEQAEQVLAALGNSFNLAQLAKKGRELFPGSVAKGAIQLLEGKITNGGGKGMAMKFKKA